MKAKLRSDKGLVALGGVGLMASVIAHFWFKSLETPFKQIVFASIFLCPAIALLAITKLVNGQCHRAIAIASGLLGLTGTLFWVVQILDVFNQYR